MSLSLLYIAHTFFLLFYPFFSLASLSRSHLTILSVYCADTSLNSTVFFAFALSENSATISPSLGSQKTITNSLELVALFEARNSDWKRTKNLI